MVLLSTVSTVQTAEEEMGECLQRLHSWKRRYPASDARVLGVVFHSDGQPVLGHSLSVQGSVHLHHTSLSTDAQIKS